jgi:ABC-type lipoprotein export system ATPase subunit
MPIPKLRPNADSVSWIQLRPSFGMPILEARSVAKIYRTEGSTVTALADVSLTVEPSQIVALVGRSGCGKSTLLNLCGAMDFPTSGEILIDGQSTTILTDAGLTRLRRQKIGFIFQSFQLLHTLTAIENVELPLLLAHQSGARRSAAECLRWVEMDSLAQRFPHQLSGGQQQRIAIARALVHKPTLLLADEPTGNLDTTTGDLVLDLLRRTATQFSVSVVMATHSLEAASIADRLIKMKDGRI